MQRCHGIGPAVFFLILTLVFQTQTGSTQGLAIYTEENPPLNFTRGNRLTGAAVAIVREILRRLKQPDNIQVLPWARGYNLLTSRANVVLFTTARTEEREDLVHWVGPLFTLKVEFYALKSRGLRCNSLADVKAVGTIATYRDDAREQLLKTLGFTNIDSSNSAASNLKKLVAGRVDLWFYDNIGMSSLAWQVGVDPSTLESVYTFGEYDGYIAISRQTPLHIVDKWQETLDQMKQDGTFERLSRAWMPTEVLPRDARTPVHLAIYTENNPPGNYSVDGKPTGFVVELVREILLRLDQPDTIDLVPWARGYNLALSRPNVALFSATRLSQREHLFQWVGPVYMQRWCFFAKKGAGLRIQTLEDAKKVPRIGTYHNDAKEQFLMENGFANLVSANRNVSNVRHLLQGDIDLWVSSDFNMPYILHQAGYDPDRLESLFTFRTVDNYIAFSLSTPGTLVAAWQKTLDDMKRDGTYARIRSKLKLAPELQPAP